MNEWSLHEIADCMDCEWHSEARDAKRQAKRHHDKTGHTVTGERAFAFRYLAATQLEFLAEDSMPKRGRRIMGEEADTEERRRKTDKPGGPSREATEAPEGVAMAPLAANDPRMVAWNQWVKTEEFGNTRSWPIRSPSYIDGAPPPDEPTQHWGRGTPDTERTP